MQNLTVAWPDIAGTPASGRTRLELSPFVTVQQYGAVGDGVNDDTVAVQAAITASPSVYFPPGEYICSNLTLPGSFSKLFGAGPQSKITFKTGSTGALIATGYSAALHLSDIRLHGGITTSQKLVSSSGSDRSGITLSTQLDAVLRNVTIDGFAKYAIQSLTGGGPDKTANLTATGMKLYNCWTGLQVNAVAEYCRFVGCDISECYIAYQITAGNTFVTGSTATNCGTGVWLYKNGNTNNSHGSFIGGCINHCVTAIYADTVDNGFVFSGVNLFSGIVLISNSSGVNITDGIFDPGSVLMTGGGRNYIRGNYLPYSYWTTTTHNYLSSADDTVIVDNYKLDGTIIESSSEAPPDAYVENIPYGTTQAIDWTAGKVQSLITTLASGALTVTFVAPTGPGLLSLVVSQGSGALGITWPAAVLWLGTEPTWASDTGKSRLVSLVYDGTSYFASSPGTHAYVTEAPASITGLLLWLRADRNVTLSGSPSTDTGLVDSWMSCDGNSYAFVQATGSKKPTWAATGINSRPAVKFDGGDILTKASKVLNSNEGMVFVVWRATALSAETALYSQGTGAIGPFTVLYARRRVADPYIAMEGNQTAFGVQGSTALAINTNYCSRFESSGAALAFEVNGNAETETAFSSTNSGQWFSDFVTTKSSVGGVPYGTDTFLFNGHIAEVIAYSRVLTAGEITTIEGYLNSRYGIVFT